jgi:uncharacterized membrane protein
MAFYYALLISPVLWIISLIFLKRWKHFKRFFIINTLVFVVYVLIILNVNFPAFANDEYGLKRFFFATGIVVAHIILGFIFSLGFYLKRKHLRTRSLR